MTALLRLPFPVLVSLLLPCCGTVAKTTAKTGTKSAAFAAKTASKAAWKLARGGGKLATAPLRHRGVGSGSAKHGQPGGDSYDIHGRRYRVMSRGEAAHYRETGIASYYGSRLGRSTASGERLSPRALTAAHKTLPFGTRVRVTNVSNGRSVIVRINDRGPFVRGRIIDLTPGGANRLDFRRQGVTKVRVETVR